MKTLTALSIAILILVPQSAYALTITHGYALVPNNGGRESVFGGANFSVLAFQEYQGPVVGAFGVDPFTRMIGFGETPLSLLRVGSETCTPIATPIPSCGGYIIVTSPGFAMPADWPRNTLFVASVPFTATGSLIVDGNQYDLTGQGVATGLRCLDVSACGIQAGGLFPDNATLTYVFTVAEPPTLLLPMVFALTFFGMVLARRRANGNS